MNSTMCTESQKENVKMNCKLMIIAAIAVVSAISPFVGQAIHVDVRPLVVATGVERVGDVNGSSVFEWDTTKIEDGWTALTSGDKSVDVLVINEAAFVTGGRLAASTTWDSSRPVLVRDDVVVPSGVTLTLECDTIVKFTEGAQIVVENGGSIVAKGVLFTDFLDDSLGGDTNFDGESMASGEHWWLKDETVASLSTVRLINGVETLPIRTYTAGRTYGELPTPTNEGAKFAGWWTGRDGSGIQMTDECIVASGQTTLYAHWVARSIAIEPQSADFDAAANNGSFVVEVNDDWVVLCDSDWVALGVDGGVVSYSVAENASAAVRTATISVQAANGMKRDFTITQSGMAQLAVPIINPADGTTFSGSSRRVSISNTESDAEIRYTLDGSEPTAASKLYTKSFNVFDTTVVKARAFKSGNLASSTVSSRIVRLQTLAEALDVPLWTVTTSGDAEWTVAEIEGHNGASCARSGAIGHNEATTLSTIVDGAGTLSFWWRADCEDDPDYDDWDYLAFEVDGVEVARIDGSTAWKQVTVKIKGSGTHTLEWTYVKDYMDDNIGDMADCGWVDVLGWAASAGDAGVPVSWIENLGVVSSGMSVEDAASLDPDGDGLTIEQEYIAGTDPNDPDSKFAAKIDFEDGKPVVTYEPDLMEERKYVKWGKIEIGDSGEDWVEVKDGEESKYNFFKVTVEMP